MYYGDNQVPSKPVKPTNNKYDTSGFHLGDTVSLGESYEKKFK